MNSAAQNNPQKAIKLGKSYPKSDIYITENNIEFYLEYNRPDNRVIAIQKEKTALLSLNSDIYKVFIKNYNKNSSYIEYARFEAGNNSNSRIYNTNYSSNNIFHDDEKLKVIEIYLKQRGDYASFVTKKRFLDLKYIEPIYLANKEPTEEKSIKLTIEDELEFDIKEFNFEGFDIAKTYTFDKKKKLHIYEYSIKRPPFVSDKDGLRGPSHYLPHILVLPKKYRSGKVSEDFFGNVGDLYKWYASLVDSINNDTGQLKPFLDELVSEGDNDIDKIKKVFYWVQQNIRYIAFEDGIAGFKPEDAHTVLNNKYGDCKGVANLTKQLLQLQGFDARLAWIGTNNRSYDYSTPSLIVDNHMICALFYNDSILYLDATERYTPLGQYAERIQNKEVLIENGESYIIEKVPVQTSRKNRRTRETNLIIDGNAIYGKTNITYRGESKSNIKYFLNGVENDKKEKALKTYFESESLEIKNISYSKLDNFDEIFTISFDFVNYNAVMSFDDELYIKFENFKNYQSAEIDTLFVFDYDMQYKKELSQHTIIEFPANYTVSYLPESINVSNNDFLVQANFRTDNNKIVYTKQIKIPNGLIRKTNIEVWNNTIKKLKEFYNSNIILKKN